MTILSWISWNPTREIFIIPYFNHPVSWYGVLFALGFVIGFFIMSRLFAEVLERNKILVAHDVADWQLLAVKFSLDVHNKEAILKELNSTGKSRVALEQEFRGALIPVKEQSLMLTDKITWFIILGTLVGARLGHVFFYDWPAYKHRLISILKIWEGGLASHGGAIGVIIAIAAFWFSIKKRYSEFSLLQLLDMACIPTALAAFFIRTGNFVNQEILGIPTTMPWAIIFENPLEGGAVVPRHPAQLYEAFAYLCTFFILQKVWSVKGDQRRPGLITGLFFILVFGSRFLLEFVKMPQSMIINESILTAGQYLSIPFIIIGLAITAQWKWGADLQVSKMKRL